MRFAVLADVHGLLPGLEAALREISLLGVDGLIVAGDMVAGPSSEEVLYLLQEHHAWMIQGNNEAYVLGFDSDSPPDWWLTCAQWGFIRWNHEHLSRTSLNFLASLPQECVVHVDGCDPIRVVHGSPRDPSELIYPDRDVTILDAVL